MSHKRLKWSGTYPDRMVEWLGYDAKLREIDGHSYRKRRGKWVQIPDEWVGKVAHPQKIRNRKSKKGQGKSYKRF